VKQGQKYAFLERVFKGKGKKATTPRRTRPSPLTHAAAGPEEKQQGEDEAEGRRPRHACARGAAVPSVPPPWPHLLVPTVVNERRTVQGCAWNILPSILLHHSYIREGRGASLHTHQHLEHTSLHLSTPLFSLG
jgi:hypothetical protein